MAELVHRGEHVLRGLDAELAREVEAGLARHGIQLVHGDHVDDSIPHEREALVRVRAEWAKLDKAFLLRIRMVRTEALFMRARAVVATAALRS